MTRRSPRQLSVVGGIAAVVIAIALMLMLNACGASGDQSGSGPDNAKDVGNGILTWCVGANRLYHDHINGGIAVAANDPTCQGG